MTAALSWLETKLIAEGQLTLRRLKPSSYDLEQKERRRILRDVDRRAHLRPSVTPLPDFRREAEYRSHTRSILRATVRWIEL